MPEDRIEPPIESPRHWRTTVCPECGTMVYETDVERHRQWHVALIRVMREIRNTDARY